MKVTLKYDEDGAYVDLQDLTDFYNIKRIQFYTLEEFENGTFSVIFYDKNKKVVKPKKNKKKKE